ncbi:MAG: MFS transporter [Bryobacteraceae bacterium]|jgi:SHS family lactate transporter-like MFS transporter
MTTFTAAETRANQRNAVLAGFLGWTLDAFDFFILVFVLLPVAHDFGRSVPAVALTLTASLAMRPLGAFAFGLLADRYGRRKLLIWNILFYSAIEVLSGLAPTYGVFLVLRLLYGVGMGGEWGVGASLALESVPAKWRGVLSGILQEGYAAGYLLAAVAYALIFPHVGWRVMFFVGGLPGLLSLFVIVKVKETEAWRQSRTDWTTYRHAIFAHRKLFLYLIALMAMMNFMSHGTQDMYPTFLRLQRHFSVHATSVITIVSMVGAIAGGLCFGLYSDHFGRKRSMVTAVLLAVLAVPLWVLGSTLGLVLVGAFLMQFMVQGAWGVIPAHLNELSPGQLRAFFPGFAYQLGVLIASSVGYVEALLAQHFSYSQSMGYLAVGLLLIGAAVIAVGPEARGVAFLNEADSAAAK